MSFSLIGSKTINRAYEEVTLADCPEGMRRALMVSRGQKISIFPDAKLLVTHTPTQGGEE